MWRVAFAYETFDRRAPHFIAPRALEFLRSGVRHDG